MISDADLTDALNSEAEELEKRKEQQKLDFAPIANTTSPWQKDNLDIAELPPVPFQTTQWRVGVLVLRPPETYGDSNIVMAPEALDTEEMLSCVGILVSMGEHAFKSQTRSGLDLSKEPANPKIGDYVLFTRYGGTDIKMRAGKQDITFKIMNDTDILGVTKTPWAIRHYL